MHVVPHKKIREIEGALGLEIKSLIEQNKLVPLHGGKWEDQYEHTGTGSYQDNAWLRSPAISWRSLEKNFFQNIIKHTDDYVDVYIDETVTFPVSTIRYHRNYLGHRKSLFSKVEYTFLPCRHPIRAVVNGEEKSVAEMEILLVMPRTVFEQWMEEYASGDYDKSLMLQVHIKGPATLYGGVAEAAFIKRTWLSYGIAIHVEDYRVLGAEPWKG